MHHLNSAIWFLLVFQEPTTRQMKYLLALGSIASLIAAQDVIERDIAILGGGCSGVYAAVALKDQNQSVVVIEREAQLGGNTLTYYDPDTGSPVNYGVLFYHDDDVSREYNERLGQSVVSGLGGNSTEYVYADFSSGTLVKNYTAVSVGAKYADELAKYPYLENGFELPDVIPDDLLLTWAQYLTKYNFTESEADATLQSPNPPGNPLDTLAIYEFNFYNNIVIEELSGEIIHSANNDNLALYTAALAVIGEDNVLLSSTVASGNRTDSGVELIVSTSTGDKTIRAKQLIVAAPPQATNLATIGLDDTEESILSQIGGYPFYTGVVKNTGLPSGYTYNNVGANTSFNVQNLPYILHFDPSTTVDGIYTYTYAALEDTTQDDVESAATAAIKTLQQTIDGADTTAEPTFVAFKDVSPFHPEQSAEDIKAGFYSDMYGLQGHLSTWYISSLFVLAQSQLWNNTKNILPDIVAAANSVTLS